MTLIEQIHHRLEEIDREAGNIRRAADGWEYYGQNTAYQIRNEVHNIGLDIARLRQMADGLMEEVYPVGTLPIVAEELKEAYG